MPTRRSSDPNKMSFDKYMSAPEFAAMRPIPGNLVLPKALLYTDPKIKELAFFLQAMSMQSGGLRAVAEQLVAWFPERCRKVHSEAQLEDLAEALYGKKHLLTELTTRLLGDFLIDLALNPELSLSRIEAPMFEKLGDALQRYKAVREKSAWDGFVQTASGQVVHKILDQALKMSRMVVAEGPAGAGKSHNARVWCEGHPGRARYVTLTGITGRTTLFQKIGAAIGLATCQRKAQDLQVKIENFFARTRMMLVIDEAHYLWPHGLRCSSTPELIDWIDTALVNNQVPVALLCTDQFALLKNRVERITGWTSDQFIHRVFRYKKLPELPTREDVEKVARSLLSATWNEGRQAWEPSDHGCDDASIDVLVSYAMTQKIPYSCVSSCIHEARSYSRDNSRILVSKADMRLALGEGQIKSDAALSRAFTPKPAERRSRGPSVALKGTGKPIKAYVSTRASDDGFEAGSVRALTSPVASPYRESLTPSS